MDYTGNQPACLRFTNCIKWRKGIMLDVPHHPFYKYRPARSLTTRLQFTIHVQVPIYRVVILNSDTYELSDLELASQYS